MIPTRRALVAFISLGFSFVGCKDKPPPPEATVAPDKPAPEPSASAVATPTPSASAAIPPAPTRPANGPKFVVRHRTPKSGAIAWLDGAAAVCTDSSCEYDASLVTEKGEVDVMNPKGIMELRYPMAFRPGSQNSVRYEGEYPNICAVFGHWEDRSSNFAVTWKRIGKGWDQGTCPNTPSYYPEEDRPRPPRELDDALLHAPLADAGKSIIHGAGAPPVLIAEQALYIWNGKTWSKREAPWYKQKSAFEPGYYGLSKRPVRLKNGSTFIPEGGYLVDAQGEITALQFESEKTPVPADIDVGGIIWAKKHPWVLVVAGESMLLTTPDESAKALFVRAPIASRAARTITPAPASNNVAPGASASASAAASAGAIPEPALSASAMASADVDPPIAPPEKKGLGELKAFTSECSAPFVLLASPPKPGQVYATTREGLRGHSELQDLVTFYELVIDGKTYFGVQTKTEADARQFMEIVEKSIKGMKPSLRCLDVTSHVSDRYAPPEGIRVVGINLTTGELVPFD